MPTNREDKTNAAGPVDGRRGGATADGGPDESQSAGPTPFETYADDAYGYRLAYPREWLVETEPAGGASFTDPRSSAGATVSIDEDLDLTLTDYVAAFLEALADDKHVRDLEPLDRREVALEGGRIGRVIDYAYLGAPDDECWRLTYLFVRVSDRGYVLGVDWNDDDDLHDLAAQIVESFTVETTD